ncbi:hypothetical protein [Jiulongibacter sp. NS-SX5]|uniref:hypothetical protein n=1 Tax=Jiulongibacter sp. NS-SX5 TaxID=3463854 RepID=UPI0040580F80
MNKYYFFFLAMLFCLPSYCQQTVIWDGGGDGVSWEDKLNWDTDEVPTANSEVRIQTASTNVIISSSTTVKSIIFGNPYTITNTLTINAGVTLTLDVPVSYGLEINRGILINEGKIYINRGGFNTAQYGGITLRNATRFENRGDIELYYYTGRVGLMIDGIPTQGVYFGGSFTMNYAWQTAIEIDGPFTNYASVTLEDGVDGFTIDGDFKNYGNLNFHDIVYAVRPQYLKVLNVPQIKFENMETGVFYLSDQSRYGFYDEELLVVENKGRFVGNDFTSFGKMRKFTNDSLVTATKGVALFSTIHITNNGTINFTDGRIFPNSTLFWTREFINNGNIQVRKAESLVQKTTYPNYGNAASSEVFRNFGRIEANVINDGFLLDSMAFQNYQGGEIIIDTIFNKALDMYNGYSGTSFINRGLFQVSNQFDNDTLINIRSTKGNVFSNGSDGIIRLNNISNGISITTQEMNPNKTFYNEGIIEISEVSNETGNAFGVFKDSNYRFYSQGLLDIRNVAGTGLIIGPQSNKGFTIEGEFKGLNNRISILNLSESTENDNRLIVESSSLLYSRGDSLYSILDSSSNPLNNFDCSIIDVENIKKVSSIVAVFGMVKLNRPGSDFTAYGLNGLLIDPFGEVYPSMNSSQRNNMDVSFGIGGPISEGLTESNVLLETGYYLSTYNGFYLDTALTQSAGNYDALTGNFTPTFTDPTQDEIYFSYTLGSTGCQYTGSIPIIKECPTERIDNHFTGAVDTDWHNFDNWSLGVVPNVCHKAIIPDHLKAVISSGKKARSAGLETVSGAVLEVESGSVGDFYLY